MHPSPLRRLSDEALRRIKAKPESEIGGILWGRVLTGSVVIEDAELVHSRGSLYNSTSSDIRCLEQAMQRNHASGLELVGYFRSHIRDGLCLSAQDQELIAKYLRNPEYVFLLIRPFEMGICVGAFFFWQDGQLQTDGSDLEVPLLALEHQPVVENEVRGFSAGTPKLIDALEEHRDRVAPPPYVKPPAYLAAERSVPEQSQASALPSRPQKHSWFRLLAFVCLIVIAAATGAATYFVFPAFKARLLERISPVLLNAQVGLKVTRAADGQLDLTWNRNAPEIAGAQQALLTVIDGPISKQLTIDAGQLHSGTLTYFPNGSDVQFRLEITLNPRHSIAESVRVILPSAPATIRAPTSIAPHAVDSKKPSPVRSNLVSAHSPVSARTLFKAPAYIPPGEVLRSRHNGEQPHAPDLKVDVVATTYATLPLSLSALPPPPSRLPAEVSSTASAKNVIPTKPPVAKPVTLTHPEARTVSTYTEPRPVRQVMPDVKSLSYALAAPTGKVEVQVTIDESGHVKDVRPVYSAGKANSLLANATITAARQWIFRPATLHGKAVVAEHRIVFDFRHESQ